MHLNSFLVLVILCHIKCYSIKVILMTLANTVRVNLFFFSPFTVRYITQQSAFRNYSEFAAK